MGKAILVVLALLAGCGGGGGQGDEVTSGNLNPSPSPGASSQISISSVIGDGSAVDRIVSSLIVNGTNFTGDMDVQLASQTTTASYDLDYTLNSPTRMTANLPADLGEGDYELSITKGTEKATASVTILRGEAGPQGEQGPAGASGITIAAQFSCIGSSNDLDPDINITRRGSGTSVVRFSDGSYFITCLSSYLNTAVGLDDTSSYSTWFASNSVGVKNGVIPCIPYYVTAEYSIPNNSVTYISQADANQRQTLACIQVYP